jgi:hypothetical protein
LIVDKNIIYPGPLERFRFNEEGIEVGYVVWEDGTITFKPLKARDLITLTDPVLDDTLLHQCTDKIVRVRLTRDTDLTSLREIAFHVQIEPIRSGITLPDGSKGTIGKSLRDQWKDFTASKGKDSFSVGGEEYLKKALEKQEV